MIATLMALPDDPEQMNALQVLTDAVRRERIPGVVEFRQLEDALKDMASDPTDSRWATADAAFNALEPDLRQRVADRANQLAFKEAENRRRGMIGSAPTVSSGGPLSALADDIMRGKSAPSANQPATGFESVNPDDVTTMEPQAPPPQRKPTKLGGGASPFLAALNRGRPGGK